MPVHRLPPGCRRLFTQSGSFVQHPPLRILVQTAKAEENDAVFFEAQEELLPGSCGGQCRAGIGLGAAGAAQTRCCAAQVETLTENMVRLGKHVTVLTNAYEGLQQSVNAMIDVSNTVVRDMDELLR